MSIKSTPLAGNNLRNFSVALALFLAKLSRTFLLYVDTSETGVTTSLGDIWIRNTADAAEAITIRDGNNSDAAVCVIEQNLQAHVRWNGSNWTSTTGAT